MWSSPVVSTAALPLLRGVEMELTDISSPLLHKVVCTDDYKTAFEGCQIALLIGARPRASGMTRADLLKANADIFKKQGKALNEYADRKVKVLVVGNPANTNAKIAMEHAPDLPRTAFTAMTRLDEIRAGRWHTSERRDGAIESRDSICLCSVSSPSRVVVFPSPPVAQLAAKAGVNVGAVRNVVVWGNHSETQYPDITFATITKDGQTVPASSLVDQAWAQGEYIQLVQSRGAAIIDAMKKSSAASAANAAIEHVRNWVLGTAPGQWVSMAVPSNGEYGVPAGLVFSFPVTCCNGEYSIVKGLENRISAFGAGKMETSWKQLEQENQGWREDGAASSS